MMMQVQMLALKQGLAVDLLSARDLNLPIFDPPETDALPNVRRWRDVVTRVREVE